MAQKPYVEAAVLKTRERVDALPPREWLMKVEHQAGGHACLGPPLFGVVLRIEANLDKGRNRPGELIRACHAMAEDPDVQLLARDFPALLPLVKTFGEEYGPSELRVLSDAVRHSFEIPVFDSGIEACLRCAECDVLEWFAGWRMLSCVAKRVGLDYVMEGADEWFTLHDELRFGGAAVDALTTAAHVLGIRRPIRAFFVWENSD